MQLIPKFIWLHERMLIVKRQWEQVFQARRWLRRDAFLSGVRSSSGAALSKDEEARVKSRALVHSWLAAPEDGRTPPRRSPSNTHLLHALHPFHRTRHGRFGSNFQPGIKYCIAAASSRAP